MKFPKGKYSLFALASSEARQLREDLKVAEEEIDRLRAVLREIANANAKANMSARDCEQLAREALNMKISRIYPVDY